MQQTMWLRITQGTVLIGLLLSTKEALRSDSFRYIQACRTPLNVDGIVQFACFSVEGNYILRNSACAGTKQWQVHFPLKTDGGANVSFMFYQTGGVSSAQVTYTIWNGMEFR